ncbi:Arc family DNA-binding protein [Pararhizobium polonicum]|uniref:Arc family DNA-binding protein n=1 Tax=Pararhizobium polonicum TaxID=1612624 RepID=UPI00083A91FC|nr:Arc family DNA-binding protein [Pararhizobium polonicum]
MADRSSYPSEQADKYLLRMPEGMREQLKEAAKRNNRSMNAEIVARIEASFTNLHMTDGKVSSVTIPKKDFDYLMANIEEINRKMKLDPNDRG